LQLRTPAVKNTDWIALRYGEPGDQSADQHEEQDHFDRVLRKER
jgi:hypothetical protein